MHAGRLENAYSGSEIVRVVERIDPKKLLVSERETRVFKPHQGDVIDEGQVSGEPLTRLPDPGGRDRVKDAPNLDPLALVLQSENT